MANVADSDSDSDSDNKNNKISNNLSLSNKRGVSEKNEKIILVIRN